MKFFLITLTVFFSKLTFAESICSSDKHIIKFVQKLCFDTNNKASICKVTIGENFKKLCQGNRITFKYEGLTCEYNCKKEKSRCF